MAGSLFGPVFQWEMTRSGRRIARWVIRGGWVSVLLGLMLAAYWRVKPEPGDSIPTIHAAIGSDFHELYRVAQYYMVLFLAPLWSAGLIADEKERKSLLAIMVTPLTDFETVFGKWAMAMLSIGEFVLAGLPVLGIFVLLGGISPDLVLMDAALAMAVAAAMIGLGLLMSTFARTMNEALILAFLVPGLYSFFQVIGHLMSRRFRIDILVPDVTRMLPSDFLVFLTPFLLAGLSGLIASWLLLRPLARWQLLGERPGWPLLDRFLPEPSAGLESIPLTRTRPGLVAPPTPWAEEVGPDHAEPVVDTAAAAAKQAPLERRRRTQPPKTREAMWDDPVAWRELVGRGSLSHERIVGSLVFLASLVALVAGLAQLLDRVFGGLFFGQLIGARDAGLIVLVFGVWGFVGLLMLPLAGIAGVLAWHEERAAKMGDDLFLADLTPRMFAEAKLDRLTRQSLRWMTPAMFAVLLGCCTGANDGPTGHRLGPMGALLAAPLAAIVGLAATEWLRNRYRVLAPTRLPGEPPPLPREREERPAWSLEVLLAPAAIALGLVLLFCDWVTMLPLMIGLLQLGIIGCAMSAFGLWLGQRVSRPRFGILAVAGFGVFVGMVLPLLGFTLTWSSGPRDETFFVLAQSPGFHPALMIVGSFERQGREWMTMMMGGAFACVIWGLAAVIFRRLALAARVLPGFGERL